MVRPLLYGRHPVPGHPALTLRRLDDGRPGGPPEWAVEKGGQPVVTFGLLVSSGDADEVQGRYGRPAGPADLPWLGVVLHPGLLLCTVPEQWTLGDLERCLAWSWLERPVLHDGQNRITGPWPEVRPVRSTPRRRKRRSSG